MSDITWAEKTLYRIALASIVRKDGLLIPSQLSRMTADQLLDRGYIRLERVGKHLTTGRPKFRAHISGAGKAFLASESPAPVHRREG